MELTNLFLFFQDDQHLFSKQIRIKPYLTRIFAKNNRYLIAFIAFYGLLMKRIIFLAYFLLLFCSLKAQVVSSLGDHRAYIERIENQYKEASSDSLKAYTALKLSAIYKREQNKDKATYYLKQGMDLAGNNAFLKATVPYYTAFLHFGESSADKQHIRQQLSTSDSLLSMMDNPEAYAIRCNAWLLLGVFAQMEGDEEKALNAYMEQALPLAEKSGNPFLIANANKFIGIIFLNAEKREKADAYLKKALALFQKAPGVDNPSKPEAIVEVTIILAENDTYLDKLTLAKRHLDQAKEILAPYPHSNLYLFYYYPEGIYYQKIGQLQKAIESLDKGIAFGGNSNVDYNVNRMKYAKFETLTKMQAYQEAIQVMQDLLKSPILLSLDKRMYMKQLADTYAKTGNLQQSNQWLEKYIVFVDSLEKANYQKDLLELEKKYTTAEKEKQIIKLEAEKRESDYKAETANIISVLGILACFLLLAAVAFLYYFLQNSRKLNVQKELTHQQQLQDIAHQQKLKLTQAILDGEEKERQRIGRDLHDGLGGVLTGLKLKLSGNSMDETTQDVVSQLNDSITELRRIARNMMPETLLRAGLRVSLQDLCVCLSSPDLEIEFQCGALSEELDEHIQLNIYRIIQELLSNAIRHSNADKILVQCLQNQDTFLITVEDNGKGFDPDNVQSSGIGLVNLRNRVNYLKGEMHIDAAPGQGTHINLSLYV